MLLLFALPVIATVTVVHRYLQLYAPTNLLVRRLRAEEPRWRTAAVLVVVGASLLMATHTATSAVANGAPGWLNLLVLVLAWDAIKVGALAICTAIRATIHEARHQLVQLGR